MRRPTKKSLVRLNWQLCREIKFLAVGRKCEICGSEIGMQVDHCFSRNNKKLFYEISNLTVLCESCHNHKTYRRKAMDLRVYEYVEGREGREEFERLRKIDEGRSAFPEWQYIWFHEQENIRLKEKLSELRGGAL